MAVQLTHCHIRRSCLDLIVFSVAGSLPRLSWSTPWDALSQQDALGGLKATLDKGSLAAIAKLGVENGFLNNPKVKIPLPPALQKVESGLRLLGMKDKADQLVTTMNRAAEQAAPLAKPLLQNAIKYMTVSDAKNILAGGDSSVTDFFRGKTQDSLSKQFLPIVKKQTDKVGLAQQYNHLSEQGGKLGLVKSNETSIESYVTQKALQGLYSLIAEEERAIRQNPVAYGSKILEKVFGSLK